MVKVSIKPSMEISIKDTGRIISDTERAFKFTLIKKSTKDFSMKTRNLDLVHIFINAEISLPDIGSRIITMVSENSQLNNSKKPLKVHGLMV